MRLIDADALLSRLKQPTVEDINEVLRVEYDTAPKDVLAAEAIYNMYETVREAIKDAPTIESPRPDWTPCAEGLPEGSGTYLVYAPSYRGGSSTGLDVINGVMFSRFKNGKWSIEHGYYKRPNCVLAWQPLHDPYNPDRKEERGSYC